MSKSRSTTSDLSWSWSDTRDGMAVAFFGRDVAASASELQHRLSPMPEAMSWLRQVHSAKVRTARPGPAGEGDAIVSSERLLALAVATADCVPVLLGDGNRIAAVHAGWRGLVSGVVGATLRHFGSASPSFIQAWIGPAVGAPCYEIGTDVAERLRSVAPKDLLIAGPSGRLHADLPAIARFQLERHGVRRIRQIELCTRCEDHRLSSYRRDGEAAGRNWSVIWKP